MAGLGFRRRREDRLGELLRLLQALGQRDAADRAGLLVVLPARADDVAAHHRLDRQGLQLLHDDRAAAYLLALFRLHHSLGIDAGELVRNHMAQAAEPEVGHLVQHAPFVRNRVGQHDVEGGEAVARHDQHLVVADGVDIADLALADARQALDARLVQRLSHQAACFSRSARHLPWQARLFICARCAKAFCAALALPAWPRQVLSAGFCKAREYEKVSGHGRFFIAAMAERCAVAASSDWPPERNTMPGCAPGTVRLSTRTVRSATSSTLA